MAGGTINLGQVAFVDKGVYSGEATYRRFNFVVTEDSCYLSLKDQNTGHPVTDAAWWRCLAKGSQATEAARKALEAVNNCTEVIQRAETITARAERAEVNANAAANSANAVAESGKTTMLQVTDNLNTLKEILPEVRSAVQTALDAYNLIAQVDGVNVFASLPATMVVEAVTEAVMGAAPVIKTKLFPETANQSVIFQVAKGGGRITPDGVISSPDTPGEMVVYAISTQKSNLWEEIRIRFRNPVARTAENGTARTAEDGTAIEC